MSMSVFRLERLVKIQFDIRMYDTSSRIEAGDNLAPKVYAELVSIIKRFLYLIQHPVKWFVRCYLPQVILRNKIQPGAHGLQNRPPFGQGHSLP